MIPDKEAAAKAKADFLEMQLKGDLDSMLGQIEINKVEAASNSIFVAGWRPFIGWACGSAFVYEFVGLPIIQTFLVVFHSHFDPTLLPKFDTPTMTTIMLSMLGMGIMRTIDKNNGTGNGQ